MSPALLAAAALALARSRDLMRPAVQGAGFGPQWTVGVRELAEAEATAARQRARRAERREAAKRYADLAARDVGVAVEFGPQPQTDGTSVTILDPDTAGDRAWWAYEASIATADHECAHVRHTPTVSRFAEMRTRWVQACMEQAPAGADPALVDRARAWVEDIRIETLWALDHPGCMGPLRALALAVGSAEGYMPPPGIDREGALAYLRHLGIDDMPAWVEAAEEADLAAGTDPPFNARAAWARAGVRARAIKAAALVAPHGPEGAGSPQMLRALKAWMADVPEAVQPPPPPPPQEPSGEGEGEGEGEGQGGGDQGQEQEQRARQARAAQAAQEAAALADAAEQAAQHAAEARAVAQAQTKPNSPAHKQAAKAEAQAEQLQRDAEAAQHHADQLAAEAGPGRGPGESDVTTWTPPEWHPLSAAAHALVADPDYRTSVRAAKGAAVRPWKRTRPGQLVHGEDAGNMATLANQRRMGRAVAEAHMLTDTLRKYEAQAGAGQLTTLVSRVRSLDKVAWRSDLCSGRVDPRRVAMLAADLTAAGCRQRRVSIAPRIAVCCVIDTSGSMGDAATLQSEACAIALVRAVRRCGGVGCIGSFHHVLLDWNDQPGAARPALSDGGTPLGQGLAGALFALSQPEARACPVRLLVVLSDGSPHDGADCRTLARRARAEGHQVMGIYLGGTDEGRAERAAREAAEAELLPAGLEGDAAAQWLEAHHWQIQARTVAIFKAWKADPWRISQAQAAGRRAEAAQLSACLAGAPATAIGSPKDLARAAVPAFRAILGRWAGERV